MIFSIILSKFQFRAQKPEVCKMDNIFALKTGLNQFKSIQSSKNLPFSAHSFDLKWFYAHFPNGW